LVATFLPGAGFDLVRLSLCKFSPPFRPSPWAFFDPLQPSSAFFFFNDFFSLLRSSFQGSRPVGRCYCPLVSNFFCRDLFFKCRSSVLTLPFYVGRLPKMRILWVFELQDFTPPLDPLSSFAPFAPLLFWWTNAKRFLDFFFFVPPPEPRPQECFLF